MAKNHVENLNYRDAPAAPWNPTGLPRGAHIRILAQDDESGAITGVLELPANFSARRPFACDAEMQLFVLEGNLRMGGHRLKPGTYCCYTARTAQPGWHCDEPVKALAIFSAAPRFAPAHDGKPAAETIAALDTWEMQWVDPLKASDPSVPFRTGVMVKVLRTDPITGASTHLAGLMPGWFSYGMETHPVYEENYCLCGDVHVAEIGKDPGYTMTEGAFLCRPAGIPHGPVLSKNGNVNFVYAHGRLGINYVDNPRSEQLVERHLTGYPWR